MWARMSRTQGSPADYERATQQVVETAPRLLEMPGCEGFAMLGNRATGMAVAITYWHDEAALKASEESAGSIRTQLVSSTGGQLIEVNRGEMIFLERAKPAQAGTFVRTNEIHGDPSKIDDTLALIRGKIAPALRTQRGFRALFTIADRSSGKAWTSSVWDTEADMEASNSAVMDLREEAIRLAGATGAKVETWEAAYANISQGATTSA